MKNFEERLQELKEQKERVEAIESVYKKVLSDYHWDCFDRTTAEDGTEQWTPKTSEDYWYNPALKKAYEDTLDLILKLS